MDDTPSPSLELSYFFRSFNRLIFFYQLNLNLPFAKGPVNDGNGSYRFLNTSYTSVSMLRALKLSVNNGQRQSFIPVGMN